MAKLDKQLIKYKSISRSSNYEQLVEQYGRLKSEIEGKLWALKELKTSEDNNYLYDTSNSSSLMSGNYSGFSN